VKIFVVEAVLSDHSFVVGVFNSYDQMITRLEEAVRDNEINKCDRNLLITPFETGMVTPGNMGAHVTFSKEGKAVIKVDAGLTLEALRA
jgi:hypothetical protein